MLIAVNRLSVDVTHIRELFSVHGCTWNKKLEIWSEPGNVLHQAKQNICVQGPLMGFINDDNTNTEKNA